MNTMEMLQDHERRITDLERSYNDLVKSNAEIKQTIESENKFTRELLKDALGHKQRMEVKELESRTSIILKTIGAVTVVLGSLSGLWALLSKLL